MEDDLFVYVIGVWGYFFNLFFFKDEIVCFGDVLVFVFIK